MSIVKLFLDYLGQLIYFFYPQKATFAIMHAKNRIYTGYLKKKFKRFGNSIIMWSPYILKGTEFIEVGENTIIEPGVQITAQKTSGNIPVIKIGSNCLIRRNSHITAIKEIIIGDYVLTGTNVLISDNSHGNTDMRSLKVKTTKREIVSKGKVTIHDNVWIGNNVCILAGVTIGEGAIIGANSVVNKNVPPYSVAVGVPIRIIEKSKP